jgi:hypothetical protein
MPSLAARHFNSEVFTALKGKKDIRSKYLHPISPECALSILNRKIAMKGLRMYAPTVEDILKPYCQYPTIIQQAILLVETNPRFIGLTRSMKAVLKALLTRASQTNGASPIKARLDTVALQAQVSTKTVERTVKSLRSAGWMIAVTEGRSAWGVFESKRYQFSNELCQFVGLPVKDGKTFLPRETSLSDGAVYVDLTFKKDHSEILFKNRTANPEQHPITLPSELTAIVEAGVSEKAVCKLRGMATAKGHQLADIFTVAKTQLIKTKAIGSNNRIYRYLAAMIAKPSDYASRAAQIERNSVLATKATATMNRQAKYANKRFILGNGTVVRIFEGMAEVLKDRQWVATIVGRDMETVYNDIENGKLKVILE